MTLMQRPRNDLMDFRKIVQRELNGNASALDKEVLWQDQNSRMVWMEHLDMMLHQAEEELYAHQKPYEEAKEIFEREKEIYKENPHLARPDYLKAKGNYEDFKESYDLFLKEYKQYRYKIQQKKLAILDHTAQQAEQDDELLALFQEQASQFAELSEEEREKTNIALLLNWRLAYLRAFRVAGRVVLERVFTGTNPEDVLKEFYEFVQGPLHEWAKDLEKRIPTFEEKENKE